MKDFMDYVKELPAIHKAAVQFQKEEIEFLKNKLDLTQKITDTQKNGGGGQSASGGGSGSQQGGVFTDASGNLLIDTSGSGQRRQEEQDQTQQSQAPQAIPAGGGTPPVQRTVPISPTGGGGATGAAAGVPQSPRMQALLEHRAQLEEQVTDPRVLFEHLRQRGMVTEGVQGNTPTYTIQIGNQRVSVDELMSNPALQSKALDQLAEQTLPSSQENGGLHGQVGAISSVAQNLLRSLGPGTSATENLKGVGEAASKIGAMGSLGNIAKTIGKIALPIGAAAGAMALVQSGGEMYQNVENLGQTHNQGFSGGLGFEMGIRSMALNPFITTEQARQITMGALNLGYTGKEFDTVTQFMAPQPHSEPVLTPSGFVKMGELNTGDDVVGADGKAKKILAIQEWGDLEVFELTFQDGSSARSSASHKWLVFDTGRQGTKIKTVDQLLQRSVLTTNGGHGVSVPRYRIPLPSPVEFVEKDLPLDPYLLGLLLGDGCFSSSMNKGHVRLSCYEEEDYHFNLPENVTAVRTAKGYDFGCIKGISKTDKKDSCRECQEFKIIKSRGCCEKCYMRLVRSHNLSKHPALSKKDISLVAGRPNHPLKVILQNLGLLGLTHESKFIPDIYLHGSIDQRFALLQGLIDTDGCISKTGTVSFANTSRQLIDDVVYLVRSLGGKTMSHWRFPAKDHPWGSKKEICTLVVVLPQEFVAPARLKRKASRYNGISLGTDKKRAKGIISIQSVGFENCRCISVEDGLYITNGFNITHNSNLQDMNMSVADSVKLLNSNVIQGGASIQSLGTQLQSLQQLSGGSTSTNTQLQQAFETASKNLVSQGVGGNQAGAIALNLAGWNQQQVNGGPNPLAQSTQTTFNNISSNPAFLQRLGQQYAPGVEYPGVLSYLSSQPGGAKNVPQDIQNVLVQVVKQFPPGNTPQTRQNAISNFMLYVNQAFGAGWSENDAQLWYNQLTGPASGLPNNQVNQQDQQLDATTANTNRATTSGGKAAGETGNDPVLGTNPASGAFSNTTLTNLVNKYGYNSVVVYDPSGKAQTLDFSNKAMMTGIGNNTWKIGVKNSSGNVGTPADIDDWRTGVATPGGNDAGGNSSGSGGTTSGTFDLTPAAAQLLKLLPGGGTVETGSNTVAANTGTNGVTPNSASVAYPSH